MARVELIYMNTGEIRSSWAMSGDERCFVRLLTTLSSDHHNKHHCATYSAATIWVLGRPHSAASWRTTRRCGGWMNQRHRGSVSVSSIALPETAKIQYVSTICAWHCDIHRFSQLVNLS